MNSLRSVIRPCYVNREILLKLSIILIPNELKKDPNVNYIRVVDWWQTNGYITRRIAH